MADKTLKPADIKKMKKQLSEVNKHIKQIEKMGGKIPKVLTKSLGVLEKAIDSGIKLGEAADEASKALRLYEKELKGACKTVSKEWKMVCEAKIDRKYLKRGVEFTLSSKNSDSAFSKFLGKMAKGFFPSAICKHWDKCAKADSN